MMLPTTDRRHFLSWAQPLLPQATAFLADDWKGNGPLDLSRVLIVVPTSQAGRRLREALADFASQRGQGVFAPRVVTPDALLATGTEAEAAIASPLDALLAWMAVFRELPLDRFRAVFPIDPPVRNFAWALRLAQEFSKLQTALGEGGLQMGDVPARVAEDFAEPLRWRQLAELERMQREELTRAGLQDGQTARMAAARSPQLRAIERIVVLATPDPLPLAISALGVLEKTMPLAVVVYAPENEKGNFDDWGRPDRDHWVKRELALPDFDSAVHLDADPVAQAARLTDWVRCYEKPEGLVALGVADPEILPPLESSLLRSGTAVFNPEGRLRRQDGLYQLLSAIAALLGEPTFAMVATLARCPDFISYLEQKVGGTFSVERWLDGLDELHARHLPGDLAAALVQVSGPKSKAPAEVVRGLTLMAELRGRLRHGTFGEGVTAVLAEIYRERKIELQREEDSHFENSAVAWTEGVRACVLAEERFGELPVADWWELALQLFAESVRSDDKPEGALELQGWLELAWENAPHLIVAGLNDGCVPEAVVGDAFLPESLRARLGLKTNVARFSRDVYLLQALASSRESGGRLDLVFGKTSAAGEPLRPSRLLLRCADVVLPERVAFLFRAPDKNDDVVHWTRAWRLKPRREKSPERVAVTGLRSWLQCPFRFYLNQVLRMKAVDPAKIELDAMDFGTMCHAALEGLFSVAMRECADEATLRNFLLSEVDRFVHGRYGDNLSLPLLVQLESARQRLSKVAEIQARERAEGWVIIAVERKFEIPCGEVVVSGRIDRIERNEKTGRVRVLDYKTSDSAVAPQDVHLRSVKADETPQEWARITVGERERVWADLQLPLYRHALAAEFGAEVGCGYFNLPKASGETGLMMWDEFPLELQESAMRCARGICEAIAAGVFWPPNEKIKTEQDDYAALFQRGTASSVEWEVVT